MDNLKINGPYKATQTWNELVDLFRYGIPLKKHRKHIKVYERSFTGSEAVNFFQDILKKKSNLSGDISKEQTIKLLDKFLKANIFYQASNSSKKDCLNFKTNGEIYLLSTDASNFHKLPWNDLNILETCDSKISNDLETKNFQITKPKKILKSKENHIEDVNSKKYEPESFNQHHTKYKKIKDALKNVNYSLERLEINQYPKISYSSINKFENHSDNKHIMPPSTYTQKLSSYNYPRIQNKTSRHIVMPQLKELSKTVVLSKIQKLLYKLKINTKILESISAEWIFSNLQQSNIHNPRQSFLPEPILLLINNLIQSTTEEDIKKKDVQFISNYFSFLERPLLTYQLYDIFISVYKYIEAYNETLSEFSSKPDDYLTENITQISYFETAFTSESPVTRVVPLYKFHKNISVPNLLTEESSFNKSNGYFYEKQTSFDTIPTKVSHFRNKSGGYLNPALCQSLDEIDNANFDYVEALDSLQRLMQYSKKPNQTPHWNDSSSECSFYTADSCSPHYSLNNLQNISKEKQDEISQELNETELLNYKPIYWHKDAQDLGIMAMQLLLLFIPPESRVQLILLLKMMKHLLKRQEDSIRELVYSTFSLSILRSDNYIQTNLTLIYQTVKFLLQNYDDIIYIPCNIIKEVERKLNSLLKNQDNHHSYFTFCERISTEQFEQQRMTESQKALSGLLDYIVNDNQMNEKDKKMRLKMFKDAYPDIYTQRFPELFSEVDDYSSSIKSRSLSSLKRIRSLRL